MHIPRSVSRLGLVALAVGLGIVPARAAEDPTPPLDPASDSKEAAVAPADVVPVDEAEMLRNATRPYALLMVIDGLPTALFEDMRAAGELPNLDAYILQRGYRSEHHTATFPPITFSAMASLLTGDLPASHGIPNFQWVNRKSGGYRNYIGLDLLNYQSDLLERSQTLFQYFPDERTLSFGLQVSAGANYQRGIVASFLDPLRDAKDTAYIGKALNADKRPNAARAAIDLVNPRADANLLTLVNPIAPGGLLRSTLASLSPEQRAVRRQIPRLVAYYTWDLDKLGHPHGLDHPAVHQALKDADTVFGQLVGMYQKAGLYDQTYFLLAADHGNAPTEPTYVPLDAHFTELGFRVKFISHELGVKRPTLKRLDSVTGAHTSVYGANMVMGTTGAGAVHIDLVKHNGVADDLSALWQDQLVYSDLLAYETDGGPVDLVAAFNALPENDFALVREEPFLPDAPHVTRVFNAAGAARIVRYPGRPTRYTYSVLAGRDPLGYTDIPAAAARIDAPPSTDREWLAATAGATYPDAVVQLGQILDVETSGTVILVPKAGCAFNAQAYTRHGGILRAEMETLFAIAGPHLPVAAGGDTFPVSRTIDIVPTLLYALQQPGVDYAEFDGIVVPELRAVLDRERQAVSEEVPALPDSAAETPPAS